jgi:hypothetical protein
MTVAHFVVKKAPATVSIDIRETSAQQTSVGLLELSNHSIVALSHCLEVGGALVE